MRGLPGASAVDGYRAARARARRNLARVLVAGGCGVAVVAWMLGPPAAVVAGVILVGAVRLLPRPDTRRWLRGAAAERSTAVLLDALPPRRWVVMHDLGVPGSRANIDHLVIGRTGVWVVDTKSTRAGVRTRWRSVYFGDRRLDPGPTEWETGVVSERLGLKARPIIAVHGDLHTSGRAGRVRVVPASELVRRLQRGRRRLGRREVARLAELAAIAFPPASATALKGSSARG